ncbi:MAG: TadE family protein [Planctomycetota bacterium]
MADTQRDNPPRPSRRRVIGGGILAAAIVSVIAVAIASGGGLVAVHSPGDWVAPAVQSRLFVTCAVVTFLCAAAVAWLCVGLWRAGAVHRAQPRDGEGGSAILEFAIVIPILGSLAMVMVQAAFLMGGNLCVHYAAYCAARSAIVQIPRDDSFRGGEDPNEIFVNGGSRKMLAIRDAAIMAVMPVSAGGTDMPDGDDAGLGADLESVFRAYGQDAPGWIDGRIGRKLRYARDHTFVTVDPPENGWRYARGEDIKVTVEHTLYMPVPYANFLFGELDEDGVELSSGEGEYGMVIRATCFMTNEGTSDVIEIEEFDVDE